MPATKTPPKSYLIVGAGNFGAATSLALIKKHPTANITLLDTCPFPNPRAASHDINKIIRTDYSDQLYMRMMLKAMPLWKSSPLYSKFFHQVGMVRADPSDFSQKAYENYKLLGAKTTAKFLSVAEIKKRWSGVFSDANFEGVDDCHWNPECGWAEADRALAAVTQAAVDSGVKYRATAVKKLKLDADRVCTGVEFENGEELTAECIILATGARTATVLAESAPSDKTVQAGHRILATGAVSFYIKAGDEFREKFKDVPVLKNCLKHTKGESMAITPDGVLKFNCDMSVTNMTYHEPSGQEISIPPTLSPENEWKPPSLPENFKQRAVKVRTGMYGNKLDDAPVEAYRICWDASTPTHDFLIAPHPHCENLFIASGGSFHGYKFLPVIGDYIVEMLSGTLEEAYVERWAWDKKVNDGHSANPTYKVEGDLKDFV